MATLAEVEKLWGRRSPGRSLNQFFIMSNFLEDLFGLKDKTAVVIGGTGVLCGEIAQGLAQAGAEIVIVGRNPDKATERLSAIEQVGGSGYFLPCEVSKKEDLQSLLGSVVERSGGVDIVVNGAGINSPTPVLDVSEDEFQNILDVNLRAVFQSCQVFGKYFWMRTATGPSSMWAPSPGSSPYPGCLLIR